MRLVRAAEVKERFGAQCEQARICARGRLPVEHLVTEVRPMSDYHAIFEDLSAGRAVKIGIEPWH